MLIESISNFSISTSRCNSSLSSFSTNNIQSSNSNSSNQNPLPLLAPNTLETVYQTLLPKPIPNKNNAQLIQTPKLL